MHVARFLPWGIYFQGSCTVCAAAISLEYRVEHEHRVSMSVGRNVDIRRTWATGKHGRQAKHECQASIDIGPSMSDERV